MASAVALKRLHASEYVLHAKLLKTMVKRELDARYHGSIFGKAWPLLTYVSQLIIYTFIFSAVLKIRVNLPGMPENKLTFALWLFAGLVPWIAFANGQTQAASSVTSRPNLTKKVVFPLPLLPLISIVSVFIESMFGLVPLLILAAFSQKQVHATIVLLPIVWAAQLLLTAGIAYAVASLSVFIRDIPQAMGIVFNLWFYLTPIVYPITIVPQRFRLWMFVLNPFTAIVEGYRETILTGQIVHWRELLLAMLIGAICLIIGLSLFRRLQHAFADVL